MAACCEQRGPLVPGRSGPWDGEADWLQVQPRPQQSTLLSATGSGANSWARTMGPEQRRARRSWADRGPATGWGRAGSGFLPLMKGGSGRVIKTRTCRQACLGCVRVCVSIRTLGLLLWYNSFVRSGNIFEKQHYKRLNVEQM